MSGLRILDLAGSPAEMGAAHGRACRDDIRRYTAGRVDLAGRAEWVGRARDPVEVRALAAACAAAHREYAPALMEEVDAIAHAAGVAVEDLVVTNGFTDFIDVVHAHGRVAGPTAASEDDCTAFIVPGGASADGRGFFGQTWDMHAGSLPFVIMLRGRPRAAPAFLALSVTGCVGMIGMNEAGIAVGINNLLGGDGRVGVTWPFIVRRILEQDDLDAALACITGAPRAGAHNYMLFDRHGRGVNVEAMATHCELTWLGTTSLVHANHCLDGACRALDRPRTPESQASSEARQARAEQTLAGGGVDVEHLMALTRDPVVCVHPSPPLQMATCGAAIMQPASGRLWAVAGPPDRCAYEAVAWHA